MIPASGSSPASTLRSRAAVYLRELLALAGRHPVALLALLPGATAAIGSFGLAEQPEHAAVGLAVLAVLTDAAAPLWYPLILSSVVLLIAVSIFRLVDVRKELVR